MIDLFHDDGSCVLCVEVIAVTLPEQKAHVLEHFNSGTQVFIDGGSPDVVRYVIAGSGEGANGLSK